MDSMAYVFETLRHLLMISNISNEALISNIYYNEVDWLVVWLKNLARYFSIKRPTGLNVMRNTSVTRYYLSSEKCHNYKLDSVGLCHSEVN